MRDLTAIFRDAPESGPAREAFEELRDWAIDRFKPSVGKQVFKKIQGLARKYGVKESEIVYLLMDPPVGEPRKELLDFLYDAVMHAR